MQVRLHVTWASHGSRQEIRQVRGRNETVLVGFVTYRHNPQPGGLTLASCFKPSHCAVVSYSEDGGLIGSRATIIRAICLRHDDGGCTDVLD